MTSKKGNESSDDEADFRCVADSTWRKLKKQQLKNGFVDGKYLGSQKSRQDGFDRGYETGFHISFRIALLKGVICAAGLYLGQSSEHTRQEAEKLKEEIVELHCRYIDHMSLENALQGSTDGDRSLSDIDTLHFSDDLNGVKEKAIKLFSELECATLIKLLISL